MSTETTTQLPLQEQPQEQPKQEVAQTTAIAKKQEYSPELVRTAINKLPVELQGIKNLFAQPWESFKAAFKDPKEADRIMQREITYTAQAMVNNNYLIKCATDFPLDFINAMKNVALSGLSLSPTLKQGYLVPFKGKVQFMPSYMGMQDLLANTGHVHKIEAHLVYKGDEFTIEHGSEEKLIHKPDPWGDKSRHNLLGGYWIAELTDGTRIFDNMPIAEVEKIKQRSPSVAKGKVSPWDTDYEEMARKTILRRGFKSLPKGSISEERMKVVEAAFDYDEKAEQSWIAEQKSAKKKDTFDEEEVEFEEVN